MNSCPCAVTVREYFIHSLFLLLLLAIFYYLFRWCLFHVKFHSRRNKQTNEAREGKKKMMMKKWYFLSVALLAPLFHSSWQPVMETGKRHTFQCEWFLFKFCVSSETLLCCARVRAKQASVSLEVEPWLTEKKAIDSYRVSVVFHHSI